MATSTKAQFLYPPVYGEGAGNILQAYGPAIAPEGMPAWLWGTGTPGAFVPFTTVNKGSLYSEVDATDDDPALWLKVDEGSDAADWVNVGSTGVIIVTSALYNISDGSSEQVVFNAVKACEIIEAGLVWNEATGGSGAAEGDITIGTASAGGQIVTAANGVYGVSQVTGTYQTLVLTSGVLAAGDSVFASHDIAAGAAGTYFLQLKIRVEA